MITGDSVGDILAWRCDAKGWYQLLRKFKRDPVAGPSGALSSLAQHQQQQQSTGGGILCLAMHPDKHKGQMLALSRQPAQLKVINMSTYKTHCSCAGYSGYSSSATNAAGGIFNRAQFSADGRYAIAGSSVKAEDGLYRLQVWETSTGHVVRTPLSGKLVHFETPSWISFFHVLYVISLIITFLLYRNDVSLPCALHKLAPAAAPAGGIHGENKVDTGWLVALHNILCV